MNKKVIVGVVLVVLLVALYFVADALLFDGVKPKAIKENNFQGNLYTPNTPTEKPAVILIGGGQWGDYWGQEFSRSGYTALSLPYNRREGLPELMEEIPLEYFESAINWLQQQSNVQPDKIIVMGASRNAELSLVIASNFPDLVAGVIAYAPSSVSWSNTVMPFNSNDIKPSWVYKGKPIPYLPMEKIKAPKGTTITTLPYWEQGLLRTEKVAHATIPVEQINGPVLLLSGKDDAVWPSAKMADSIASRLKAYNFKHEFKNIQYKDAGHLVSGNPNFLATTRTNTMYINNTPYEYNYGGTAKGDQKAQQDAKQQVFNFLAKL